MKKIFISGFMLSVGLLLSGCGSKAATEEAINLFGKKTIDLQEFVAESEVKTNAFDSKGNELLHLRYENKMNIKADFKEKEMYIKNTGSENNEHNDLTTDIYIKDQMMYMNPFGDWLIYPELDDAFGESLKVNNLTNIHSELNQIKENLEYSKTKETITLKAYNLSNVHFDKKTLEAIFGPASGLDKAKVTSYFIEITIDPNTYLPISMKRNFSILLDNVTYKTKTNITYNSFEKVDIDIPKEALDTRMGE